jgi:hypothetical protein
MAEEIWGEADVIWEDSEADYQGHATILARTPDGRWWFYEWFYGSCSGCDTWEAADLSFEAIKAEMINSAVETDDPAIMLRFLTGGTCERLKGALAAMKAWVKENPHA